MPVPSIPEWLEGKNILISGGTGYLGKVLIEKLLRSCPKVGKIYLLIRSRRGKTPHERLEVILKSPIWKLINFPYDFDKIVPVGSDLSVAGLGLADSDRELLENNVHIVFHAAASVKFTEPFAQAVFANVRLTRDMVELSKKMRHLELFVHVSTAYVNMMRDVMDEKVHEADMDWRKAIQIAEEKDQEHVVAVTDLALGNNPNTYIFTKKMAENLVWNERNNMPILIHRPVIVTALWKEPGPGWTDNRSGPEIVIYAIGKGILKVLGHNQSYGFNFCPGDTTINGLLASAWKVACHSKNSIEKPLVYNSTYFNPPERVMLTEGAKAVEKNPIPDPLWKESFPSVTNDGLFFILHLLFNHLPMLIVQTAASLAGHKFPLVKAARDYYIFIKIIFVRFFNRNYDIRCENLLSIDADLSPEDKKMFDFQCKLEKDTIKNLLSNSLPMCAKMLNERDLSLKVRLQQRKRMVILDKIVRYGAVGLGIYYFSFFSLDILAPLLS